MELPPGQVIGESGLPEWTAEGTRGPHLQAQVVANAAAAPESAAADPQPEPDPEPRPTPHPLAPALLNEDRSPYLS